MNLFSVEVFWPSDPYIEVASNLVTNDRAKRQPTPTNEPPSKHQKSSQGDRTLAATPIEVVRESYRSAIHDGHLKYGRKPRLASVSDGSPKVELWDPYILAANHVTRAVLLKEKVADIRSSVESAVEIVPKAAEWNAKSREHGLTPGEMQRILRMAFVGDVPKQDDNGNLPPILKVAANALRRAEELKKRGTVRPEVAVLRMVAYASIEVSIVAGEATEVQVSTIDIVLFIVLT
jgi:hypothetical protein